jgi:predicted phosphodiesterase
MKEPTTAILSDIHANAEALEKVLDEVKGLDIVLLGDTIDYGPYPRETLDMLIELGDRLKLVVRGDHEWIFFHPDIKKSIGAGAQESAKIQRRMLLTDNPDYFLSDECLADRLSKIGLRGIPGLQDEVSRTLKRKARAKLGFWGRISPGAALGRYDEAVDEFAAHDILGIFLRNNESIYRVNSEPIHVKREHEKAIARHEFLKMILGSDESVMDGNTYYFHACWDKSERYVLDGQQEANWRELHKVYQREDSESAGHDVQLKPTPGHVKYEEAVKRARSLGRTGRVAFIHGHTHVPSICTAQEGDFIMVDAGGFMPRLMKWRGYDGTGIEVEVPDAYCKASYAVTDGTDFQIRWVGFDWQGMYGKMKEIYGWDERSPEEREKLDFMRMWARKQGEWPQKQEKKAD